MCPICGGSKCSKCAPVIYAMAMAEPKRSNRLPESRSLILLIEGRYSIVRQFEFSHRPASDFDYALTQLLLLSKSTKPGPKFREFAFDYLMRLMGYMYEDMIKAVGVINYPTHNFFFGPIIRLFGVFGFPSVEETLIRRYSIIYKKKQTGKRGVDKFYEEHLKHREGIESCRLNQFL